MTRKNEITWKDTVKLWHEMKLLLVGLLFLDYGFYYAFFVKPEWYGYNVGMFSVLETILISLGTLAIWRWINNQSKWEPHFSGKYLALFGIALVFAITIILIAALFNLGNLITVIKGFSGQ